MDGRITQLINLAETTLVDAEGLITFTQGYRSAISRAYYAVFYAAETALLSRNIMVKSHSGLISQFSKCLILPGIIELKYGQILKNTFDARLEGDYTIFAEIDEQAALQHCKDARKFIKRIRQDLSL